MENTEEYVPGSLTLAVARAALTGEKSKPVLKENFLQIHEDMIHRLMGVCSNHEVVKDIEIHLRKFNKAYGDEARMVFETTEKLRRMNRHSCIEFLKKFKHLTLVNRSGDKIRLVRAHKSQPYILTKQVSGGEFSFYMSIYDLQSINPAVRDWKPGAVNGGTS